MTAAMVVTCILLAQGLTSCGGGGTSEAPIGPSAFFSPDSYTTKVNSSTTLGLQVPCFGGYIPNAPVGGCAAAIYPVKWTVMETTGGTLTDPSPHLAPYQIIYSAPAISGTYHVIADVATNPPVRAIASITVTD
jgi:hypothetical protein